MRDRLLQNATNIRQGPTITISKSDDPNMTSTAVKHVEPKPIPDQLLTGPLDQVAFRTDVVSILPILLPTLPPSLLQKLSNAVVLDGTHSVHLKRALQDLKSSVVPGSVAMFEITTRDGIAPSTSTNWFLASLPFTYAKPGELRRQRPVQLFDNLGHVLTLLAHAENGTNDITIVSVQNVSSQFAQLLYEYAESLEKPERRSVFIPGCDKNEEYAWRSEMLWARWEAACYACGLLSRWVVCVKKPTGSVGA